MSQSKGASVYCFLLGCFLSLATSLAVAAPPVAGMKIEPGTFVLGTEPWLGYGLFHVAQAHGLFNEVGIKVQIKAYAEDKDVNEALANGEVDAATVATHTAIGMVASGLKVKAVMLLDQSLTADAVIAGGDIKTAHDLKGKTIALEIGSTSDILLHRALESAGLSPSDVKIINLPAKDAGTALIDGKVQVAVTYEPYLSLALAQDSQLQMVYSGQDDPGIISDVLLVRDEVIAQRPGQVLGLVQAWGDTFKHYQNDTLFDRAVIAKAVGSHPDELASAFDGVKYYSLPENVQLLAGSFSSTTFPHVLEAAMAAGLVTGKVKPEQMIDARFVKLAH